MTTWRSNIFLFCLCVCHCAIAPLRSPAAEPPGAFDVSLRTLERATAQHNSTLKTLDTFSRQVINAIAGRSTLDGQEPLATVLDIAYRPEAWSAALRPCEGALPTSPEGRDGAFQRPLPRMREPRVDAGHTYRRAESLRASSREH